MTPPIHFSQCSLSDFGKSDPIMSFPCLLQACQCHSAALRIMSALLTRGWKVIREWPSIFKSISSSLSNYLLHSKLQPLDPMCRSLSRVHFLFHSKILKRFFFLLPKICILPPPFSELTATHPSWFCLDGVFSYRPSLSLTKIPLCSSRVQSFSW